MLAIFSLGTPYMHRSLHNLHSSPRSRSRLRRISLWSGAILLALVGALGLALSITDWNFARARLSSMVAGKIHREIRIDGNLSAHLLSWHPQVRIEKIIVSSPEWVGGRDFATVERIDFAIDLRELLTGDFVFDTLSVEKPNVALISDKEGRANFSFADPNGANDGNGNDKAERREVPTLPAVRHFTLRGGELYVRDENHRLTFQGTVEANEQATNPDREPFKLRGEGTLNDEPFTLLFTGSPLANLRMDQRYEFVANVSTGKTDGAVHGTFAKPFDVAQVTASLDVKGDNLAHLYYLTNLALPFTPPYHVSGVVRTSKQRIFVDDLNGKVGNSDVRGAINVDLATIRPTLTAELRSQSLNLEDLSPSIGKGVKTDPKTGEALDSVAPGDLPPDKLFPTYRFEFDRLSKMDADVRLHAASVQTKKLPLKEVGFHLKLNDSVLTMDPLVFTLPQGKIAATIQVDAREKVARNKLDVRLTNVQLDQFKGKNSPEAPFDGVLEARMQVSGPGNSVHDLAANATGKLNAVVPHGEVRQAFAELLGINVARGLGLLLSKDQTKAEIRCGIATVDIRDGKADIDQMIFDTDTVLIKGDGNIELAPEKLDLDISGHPKKPRIVRLRTPVTVNGTLRKPAFGVDAGEAAKQVGIAALIGALFSPLTSALAFIDPGLAKDENCAALLTEAKRAQASNVRVQPAHSSWISAQGTGNR